MPARAPESVCNHDSMRLAFSAMAAAVVLIGCGVPTPGERPVAEESWDDVEQRLDDLPGEARALVTVTDGDGTDVLFERNADAVAPVASMSKLFVLIALVDQLDAGTVDWGDTLRLTDAVRSLPTGELQDEPDGTEVTVREAAQAMIEISDNTATDLLVAHIGREAVETSIENLDLPDGDRLLPFVTTREKFALAWNVDDGTVAAWRGGDTEARRAVLAGLSPDDLDVAVEDITETTVWQRDIDWFASPRAIGRAHEVLAEASVEHPELIEVLGANPGAGLDFDRDAWPEIAFKGGSTRGVIAGSWTAEAADGFTVTVVITLAGDSAATVRDVSASFFGLAEHILRLVSEEAAEAGA